MDRSIKRTYNARPTLRTFCQPGAMKKCAALLRRHQRCGQLIKKAGFLVIFEAEDVVVYRNLLDHLVRYWDEEAKVFNIKGRTLHFTEQEVALITGLPAKGETVEVIPTLPRRSEGQFFIKYFAVRRPDILHIDEIIDKLSEGKMEMAEEDMARMIICLLFCTMLFPHSTRALNPSLYRYIEDLPRLSSYNWAGAMHNMLIFGITHTNRLVGARSQGGCLGGGYLNGASYVLQIWFFEHTTIFHAAVGPTSPRVKRWPGSGALITEVKKGAQKKHRMTDYLKGVFHNLEV